LDDGRQSLATLGTLPEKRTICREFTLAYPSNPGEGPQHAFLLVAASLTSGLPAALGQNPGGSPSPQNKEIISGYMACRDIEQNPGFILQTDVTRTIFKQGMNTWLYFNGSDNVSKRLPVSGRGEQC
jgi:hypothetical protein